MLKTYILCLKHIIQKEEKDNDKQQKDGGWGGGGGGGVGKAQKGKHQLVPAAAWYLRNLI